VEQIANHLITKKVPQPAAELAISLWKPKALHRQQQTTIMLDRLYRDSRIWRATELSGNQTLIIWDGRESVGAFISEIRQDFWKTLFGTRPFVRSFGRRE
jgi:hypothetical protein